MLRRTRSTPLFAKTTDWTDDLSGSDAQSDSSGLFESFDRYIDRLSVWPFHAAGGVAALAALWFAMALAGGIPGGVVEWITVGLFAVFSYAVGFLALLLATCLFERISRLPMVAFIALGAGVWGLAAINLAG